MSAHPFRMILLHPAWIVLTPPLLIVPLIMLVVGTPLPVHHRSLSAHRRRYALMILQVLLQIGMRPAKRRIIDQARISLELRSDSRVIAKKLVEVGVLPLRVRTRCEREHQRGAGGGAEQVRRPFHFHLCCLRAMPVHQAIRV